MKTTPGVLTKDSVSGIMMNDYVELDYKEGEEEEEVEVEVDVIRNVSDQVLRYTQNEAILAKELELAESMSDASEIIINIYNNQVYHQSALDEARLVNNHGQDLTFGNKL